MNNNYSIYIAGHMGLLGSAIYNKYKEKGYRNIIVKTRAELDLTRQNDVENFFDKKRPQYVILAAARVGGIYANITYPAQFIYENIAIQTSVIHSAYLYGVKKLLFFGSACSYPRDCSQPIKEEYLLSGYIEPTNEPYAVAKLSGIKMCQSYNKQYGANFICGVPANVYGPGDNFDTDSSHVIPALISKIHQAKIRREDFITVWGTGNCRREFLYVDDVAEASVFLMNNYNGTEIVNVGVGKDVTVKDLAYLIGEVIGYGGGIIFDTSKPDGIPRKMLDVSKINRLGWQAKVSLDEGIRKTYEWYLSRTENKERSIA